MEDTHKKNKLLFIGRTTKVRVTQLPPWTLVVKKKFPHPFLPWLKNIFLFLTGSGGSPPPTHTVVRPQKYYFK